MNNKGFTLVELLATIVILGLVTSFVFVTVTDYYSASKDKSEEVFYKQIESYMEDYIALDGSKEKKYENYGTVRKHYCEVFEGDTCKKEVYEEVTLEVCKKGIDNPEKYFKIEKVAEEIVDGKLINPKTGEQCTDTNTNITVYRDSDFVYCYIIKPVVDGEPCLSEYIDENGETKQKVINTCEGRYKKIDGNDILTTEEILKELE